VGKLPFPGYGLKPLNLLNERTETKLVTKLYIYNFKKIKKIILIKKIKNIF
jgi:hypothetical protein